MQMKERRLYWNIIWILLIIAGIGVYMIGMPRIGDDYMNSEFLRDWFESQGVTDNSEGGNFLTAGFPYKEILATWEARLTTNVARIGNLLAPIILTLPDCIGCGLMLLLISVILLKSLQLAKIDLHHSALVPLYLLFFTILISCGDYLGELDFQINYIPALLFGVMIVKLLFKDKVEIKNLELRLFILGLLAGGWHEGIGLPVVSGLIALFALNKASRNKATFAAIIGLMVGLSCVVFSPGAKARMTQIPIEITNIVPYIYFLPMLAVIIFAGVKRGVKVLIKDRFVVFGVISCMASIAVMWYSNVYCRSGWWAYYISGVLTIYLIAQVWPELRSRYTKTAIITSIVVLGGIISHWGLVGYHTIQFRNIVKREIAAWIESPYSTRFDKVTESQNMPLICYNLPSAEYELPFSGWMAKYYAPIAAKRMKVEKLDGYKTMYGPLPEALRYVTADSGKEISGGSKVRNVLGYLVMEEDDLLTEELKRHEASMTKRLMEMDFGKGYTTVRVIQVSFISEADGKRYSYLKPWINWYVRHFKDIKAISSKFEFEEKL